MFKVDMFSASTKNFIRTYFKVYFALVFVNRFCIFLAGTRHARHKAGPIRPTRYLFSVYSLKKKIKNGKNQRRFLEIILDLAAHKCYLNLEIK